MKKTFALAFLLVVLTISSLSVDTVQAFPFTADTPYVEDSTQYFKPTDPCGYLMGVASGYPALTGKNHVSGTVKLTPQGNNVQGCFDASGYAYADSSSVPARSSRATYTYTTDGGASTTDYTIDFFGLTPAGVRYQVNVDQTTGVWSGWGRIVDPSFPGTAAQRWVWFNWNCSLNACTADQAGKYYVTTTSGTGMSTVSGYAWNDFFGFISFTGLTQEPAPEEVYMEVSVLSSDGSSGPEDVTALDAPIADGYDYWRVRVQFVSNNAYLDSSDLTSISLTPQGSGTVYLNQVENTGNAIVLSDTGTWVKNPSTAAFGQCSTSGACALSEDDAEATTSWNTFVRSASPTSNMIGLDNDTDAGVDYLGDRDACRWVYYDQYHNVDGTTQPPCASILPTYLKSAYYYNRVNDRNQYVLDHLVVNVSFANTNTSIATNSYLTQQSDTQYTYAFHNTSGDAGQELSWRPRYQLTNFSALYGGSEHDEISADSTTYSQSNMILKTAATVADTSDAFQHAFPGYGYTALQLKHPAYVVKYQLEVDKGDYWDETNHDLELILDTDADSTPDCTRRTDTVGTGYGPSGVLYTASYPMKYGQKSASTCGGSVATPANTVSNPTAEQWVCDRLKGALAGQNPQLSCYFTGYLPRIDRHTPAYDMLVIGAINSTVSDDTFFTNDSTLSVLGATDVIKLRNKMYAQIVRYTLGQSTSSAQAHLDSAMEDGTGSMLSMLSGRFLYSEGDIVVDGSAGFSDKTIVTVGGNIIIRGNVTGGRLGVIAFANADGDGGNVYIEPDVTELYANFFLDGALLPFDGVTVPTRPVEFQWPSDEARVSTLLNQLYLNGSLVSRNTVNGAPHPTGSSTTSWSLGDGTTTSSYDVAREHDLNQLRQYRRCYDVDPATGLLTSTQIDCGEGENLSSYGQANGFYNSFILDYSPADELPIFRAESGLFQ